MAPAAQAAFPGENGRIAYEREGDIYSVSPTDLSPRLEVEDARDPAYAPDGERLAFSRDGDVYTTDGTETTRVTGGEEPSFSRTGQEITFIRDGAVWIAGSAGERRLEPPHPRGLLFYSPVFSPVADLIASTGENAFGDGGIYTRRADGSQLRGINTYGRADFSSDGREVLSGLYVARANGGGRLRMIELPRRLYTGDAVFSPDGSRIVFATTSGELWTVALDGSDLTRLTQTPEPEKHPSWGTSAPGVLCSGRLATVSGTPSDDVLRGDGVIAGLGGRDRIVGGDAAGSSGTRTAPRPGRLA